MGFISTSHGLGKAAVVWHGTPRIGSREIVETRRTEFMINRRATLWQAIFANARASLRGRLGGAYGFCYMAYKIGTGLATMTKDQGLSACEYSAFPQIRPGADGRVVRQ